jgi:hypothetical protein
VRKVFSRPAREEISSMSPPQRLHFIIVGLIALLVDMTADMADLGLSS